LLRQVTASLVLTVAVFTLVLLLGSVLRELLPLLISQKATLGLMGQAVGLLIPFVVAFALPIGMLTASLLVFGRFSADQELTAARASGVSLLSLVTPVVLLSIVLCGVSLVVNLEVAPRSRVAFLQLTRTVKAALMDVRLPEGRVITEIPGHIIYVGKNRRQELQDVRIYILAQSEGNPGVGRPEMSIYAPRGRIEKDAQAQRITLHLYDAQAIYLTGGKPMYSGLVKIPLDLAPVRKSSGKLKITDMTFTQLLEELRHLEAIRNPEGPADAAAGADKTPAGESRSRRPQSGGEIVEVIRMEIHRRWAFSFACFGFTLVGIPLGIRVHRRETNIGIAIALVLLAVYYALIHVAQWLSGRPELQPQVLMWLPNLLFQAVGAFLLWRANRGI
jgi:lipopolysaccharide export system permease protein